MNTISMWVKQMADRHKLRRALRDKRGYSLGETMVALIIVSLLSMCIATGVAFGVRQYKRAMILSESRVLCSTLATVIRSELNSTPSVWTEDTGGRVAYFSLAYASSDDDPDNAAREHKRSFFPASVGEGGAITINSAGEDYGQIAVATVTDSPTKTPSGDTACLLLNSAAYALYHLQAKVNLDYNATDNIFTVNISVRGPDKKEQTSETFEVIPLNQPDLNPT